MHFSAFEKITVGAEWMKKAACKYDDPALYNESFTNIVPDQVSCRTCPVRVQCLTDALEHGGDGVWGGTTDKERRIIKKRQKRAMCPAYTCRSKNIARGMQNREGMDLCLSCGLTWPAPMPRSGQAKKSQAAPQQSKDTTTPPVKTAVARMPVKRAAASPKRAAVKV